MNVRKIRNFPYEIKDVGRETSEEFMKIRTGVFSGFVQVGPKDYFLPQRYEEEAAGIYNFPLRPDDTFIVTFPKSGTTWVQELVWLVANDLDYARAAETNLTQRFPFLELTTVMDHKMIQRHLKENKHDEHIVKVFKKLSKPHYSELTKLPSPRFIKSHLAFSLLPPSLLDTCRVVFVTRNPRDVAVSYYYHQRVLKLQGYIGDFKTFWNSFIKGVVNYAPFFDMNKEAWEKRNHPNMLFLFYEELSKDLPAAINKVCTFLGKQYSEEEVTKLSEHLHIDNFRKNKSVNAEGLTDIKLANKNEDPFVRTGKTGGWHDYFDEEMSEQAERWIADNLRDVDLRYPTT